MKGVEEMLKSMTGYGRCELTEQDRKIIVEMKSVNHRYLDMSIKMPKKFNCFDAQLRKLLQEYCSRGKLDVYISYEDMSEGHYHLTYNKALAGQYVSCLQDMAQNFGLANDLNVSQLAKYPDILVMEEAQEDMDALWTFISKAVTGAAEQFTDARKKEGESLQADLIGKLDNIADMVAFIEEHSPQIIEEYRTKLTEKVQDFLQDASIDEGRILAEVTVFADKACVDEELVRLKSHLDMTRQTLVQGGSVGRNLDFIIQEMNREANTILSKTSDIEISNRGIALKTEIEKIREQVQNIE